MQLVEEWPQLLVSHAQLPKMSELFAVELVIEVCQRPDDRVQLFAEAFVEQMKKNIAESDQLTWMSLTDPLDRAMRLTEFEQRACKSVNHVIRAVFSIRLYEYY
jgi:glucuronate isomerase